MKVYSLRGVFLRQELLPERTHRQTVLLVRARTKKDALALMSAAVGGGAKFGEADWRFGGGIPGPKLVQLAAGYPDGTVLYSAGREFSDDWRVLKPALTGA